MMAARLGLAALPERVAIFRKGRALVEDTFDLNFAGGAGPDRPARTHMAALCGDVDMHAAAPWTVT